jgi:hypothetical protein
VPSVLPIAESNGKNSASSKCSTIKSSERAKAQQRQVGYARGPLRLDATPADSATRGAVGNLRKGLARRLAKNRAAWGLSICQPLSAAVSRQHGGVAIPLARMRAL